MREIGEQWIENDRMYKVVLPGLCDGCDFNMGCLQNGGVNCKAGHCVTKQGHVKDLGPVNEDGLLGCPFCGEFPTIIYPTKNMPVVAIVHTGGAHRVLLEFFRNKQEVIDTWNRRA